MNDIISVVVPVYNTEKWLDKCIRSILEQTYDDFELILIDDGSTDDSGIICDKYAKRRDNVNVIHNKNHGPAASREIGVKLAKGDLVLFVDSDDWVAPNLLQILKEKMELYNADICCCNYLDINKYGKKSHFSKLQQDHILFLSPSDCMRGLHKERLLNGSPVTKLYKKKLFQNIDFHSNVIIGEDYSMIVQLYEKAERVLLLKDSFYYRNKREGSISHSGFTERHKDAFDNYMKIRCGLIKRYPEWTQDIIGFHIEYEMAVFTAMIRSKTYDEAIIFKLKEDLRKNSDIIWKCKKIPAHYRVSAYMIAYATGLFTCIYRLIYILTGR